MFSENIASCRARLVCFSPIRRVSKIVPRRVCSVFERTNNIARFCGAITNPVGRDWCAFHQSAGYPNRVRRIDQTKVNLALPTMHAGMSCFREILHPGGRDWCAFHQSAEWHFMFSENITSCRARLVRFSPIRRVSKIVFGGLTK